jgi:hypothetical protein
MDGLHLDPDRRGTLRAFATTADLPPIGTYRAEITVEDLEGRGRPMSRPSRTPGLVTLTFHLDRATIAWNRILDNRCEPSYTATGDVVRFVFCGCRGCTPGTLDLSFELVGDILRPTVVATDPPADLPVARAFFERDWQAIE